MQRSRVQGFWAGLKGLGVRGFRVWCFRVQVGFGEAPDAWVVWVSVITGLCKREAAHINRKHYTLN